MSSKETNKNGTKTSSTTPSFYPSVEQCTKPASVDMLVEEHTPDNENSITNKDYTPPPRSIRLIRYTPNNKAWKKETEQIDTHKSSPLARPPSNKNWGKSQEKPAQRFSNDEIDLAEADARNTRKSATKATDSKLLDLLRSKSTIGNFHNTTLHKSELKSAPRSTNTIPAFISANNTARVRSDVSPRANSNNRNSNIFMSSIKTVLNNGTSHVCPIKSLNKKFSFTSNVKELLQNDETANPTSKDDDSLSSHDKDIENRREKIVQNSADKSLIETESTNTIIDKRAIGLPIAAILNKDDSGIQPFGVLGGSHKTVETLDISYEGDVRDKCMTPSEQILPPEGNNIAVRVLENMTDSNKAVSPPVSPPCDKNNSTNEDQTVDHVRKDNLLDKRKESEPKEVNNFEILDQIKEKRSEISASHTEEKGATKEGSMETSNDELKSSHGNFSGSRSSKTALEANKKDVQNEMIEKDEFSMSSVKTGESHSVNGEGGGLSEKWNAALKEEPPASDSRHRGLVNLFSSVHKTNFRNQGDATPIQRFLDLLSTAKITLNADLTEEQRNEMESLEDGGKTQDNDSIPMKDVEGPELNSNIQTDHHSLKGSVISFPSTSASRRKEETTSHNLNAVKMELVYITEQEESPTSSDGEHESIFKTSPSKTRSSKLARRQYFGQRRVVAPSPDIAERSSDLSSPKRELPKLIDPEIERRKFDREFATNVLTKLGQKHLYDRNTIAELIQEGVTRHNALDDNNDVSVTNNVCSVNNYEISHAYYYQQMPRRGKLEYIPLHGRLSAGYYKTGSKEDVATNEDENEHEEKVETMSIPETPSFKGNVDHVSKENWKQEWHSKLKTCRIFFDNKILPVSVPLEKDPIDEQFLHLKNIFQEKFGAKVTDFYDSSVDIVILREANKCDEENHIFLNDSTQVSREPIAGRKVRVWCLDKVFQFLENIGVDPTEWKVDQEVIVDMPIKTSEAAETTLEEEPSDEEDDEETWQFTVQDGSNSIDLSRQLPTLELAKAPIVSESASPSSSPESTEEDDNNELDVNMDTVCELQYLEELLQTASSAMDKKDNDLKTAQKLILALSREVLQNELKITSLTGQLTAAKKEVKTQRAVVSDYRDILAQKEECISGLSKRRWEESPERVTHRSISPLRKVKKLQK